MAKTHDPAANVHHKVAFRCTHCGHLVAASAAGESHTPHACPGCGQGVHFTTEVDKTKATLTKKHAKAGARAPDVSHFEPLPGFHKVVEHDCWEVLADATAARLKELGLAKDDVEAHTPAPKSGPARPPVMAAAHAKEEPAAQDRAG